MMNGLSGSRSAARSIQSRSNDAPGMPASYCETRAAAQSGAPSAAYPRNRLGGLTLGYGLMRIARPQCGGTQSIQPEASHREDPMFQGTIHDHLSRIRRGITRGAAAAAVAGLTLSAQSGANAQDKYPDKPVKLIVGFAPGGPTDILARVVGNGMGKILGEQFYVENRTGAG